MRLYQIGTFVLVTGMTVLAFQNCAKQGSSVAYNADAGDRVAMEKSMEDIEGQIRSLSARDLSCAADADCAIVAVGASHCGGPTFLVLGSKLSGDYASILDLAKSFKTIEHKYMRDNNLMGSCNMLDSRPPTCVANRCVVPQPI